MYAFTVEVGGVTYTVRFDRNELHSKQRATKFGGQFKLTVAIDPWPDPRREWDIANLAIRTIDNINWADGSDRPLAMVAIREPES